MTPPRSLAIAAIAGMTAVVALSGCAAFSNDAGPGNDSGKVQVTAGLYPLTWLSEEIAGENAEVVDLTPRGTDPHDLELTPVQTAQVADADLVVLEKGLQAPLDEAADQSATGTVLDVSDAARLVPIEHEDEDPEEHAAHEEEGEEHDHEGHEDEGHEGHDHGAMGDLNPHFWQDPLRMADVAGTIADELAEVDPDHEDAYRANADKVVAELEDLDQAYATGLKQCARDTDVVTHDAFGYLTRYGLHFEPIAGLSPDAEPTPAALADLHQVIKDHGITTVFTERLASTTMARSLASDAGVKTDVLDPLEGLTEETADEDYLSLMTANLEALQKANGCR